jgi:dienelactone hydrolase
MPDTSSAKIEAALQIPVNSILLNGDLVVPEQAVGLVIFAHGSGSSRHSSRNRYVAEVLQQANLATMLMDLLTEEEEAVDVQTRQYRFDMPRLAERLAGAARWLSHQEHTQNLPIGFFGASTGGGAALMAAAELPDLIHAVVSRGGRPDLAGPALPGVKAPTLLIVGGQDNVVIDLNQEALRQLTITERELTLIQGATHLFEEPGTLEEVARLAAQWFHRYLPQRPQAG